MPAKTTHDVAFVAHFSRHTRRRGRPRRPGRVAAGQRADLVLVSGDPLTDITATRAIERIWRGGIACDRHAFVASAAEAEQLDAFDAQLAKVVAAVRERWSG